jgi:hypothetical protein
VSRTLRNFGMASGAHVYPACRARSSVLTLDPRTLSIGQTPESCLVFPCEYSRHSFLEAFSAPLVPVLVRPASWLASFENRLDGQVRAWTLLLSSECRKRTGQGQPPFTHKPRINRTCKDETAGQSGFCGTLSVVCHLRRSIKMLPELFRH